MDKSNDRRRKRAEPSGLGCCDDLEEGQFCKPGCVKRYQNDETALPAEVGFYRHFEFNATTGR